MTAKVLVVDDEPDILFTVRLILELAGYDVLEASTGAEAIAFYERDAPDAILLDVSLPDIDGWEVLKRLRDDKGLDTGRVIMLSAHVSQLFSEMAAKFGCRRYVAKPFRNEEVLDALSSVVTSPA